MTRAELRLPLAALLLSSTVSIMAVGTVVRASGIPVVDALAVATGTEHHLETIIKWVAQAKQMGQVIQTGRDTVYQATNIYNNFTRATDVASWGYAINSALVRAPLPASANDVRNAMAGVAGFAAGGGFSLSGLFNAVMSTNTIYSPVGTDRNSVRMREEAASNAAQIAMAQQAYESSARRLDGINELRARIGQPGLAAAERMDLQARLAAETGQAQAQTNQLLALQMWQQAEADRQRQQGEQVNRRSADTVREWARSVIDSRGRTGVPAPLPTTGTNGMTSMVGS